MELSAILNRIKQLQHISEIRSAEFQNRMSGSSETFRDELMKQWIMGEFAIAKLQFFGLLALQSFMLEVKSKKLRLGGKASRKLASAVSNTDESMAVKAEKMRFLDDTTKNFGITISGAEMKDFLLNDEQLNQAITENERSALISFFERRKDKISVAELSPEMNYRQIQ